MNPLISVITINFNNNSGLIRTSESVLKQSSKKEIEWIVVDGNSTDGSVEYLSEIQQHIDVLMVESDQGIYDAMNKGFNASSGDYVLFLNSGDTFHSADVIALTLGFIHEVESISGVRPQALFGDTQFVTPKGEPIGLISKLKPQPFPTELTGRSFRFGMNICHQSLFLHRSVFVPFNNKRYRLAADVDAIIASLKKLSTPGLNMGFVVSDFEVGGSSYQHTKKAWKERFEILGNHYGPMENLLNHAWILIRRVLFDLKLYKP